MNINLFPYANAMLCSLKHNISVHYYPKVVILTHSMLMFVIECIHSTKSGSVIAIQGNDHNLSQYRSLCDSIDIPTNFILSGVFIWN